MCCRALPVSYSLGPSERRLPFPSNMVRPATVSRQRLGHRGNPAVARLSYHIRCNMFAVMPPLWRRCGTARTTCVQGTATSTVADSSQEHTGSGAPAVSTPSKTVSSVSRSGSPPPRTVTRSPNAQAKVLAVSGLPLDLTHSYGAKTVDDSLLGAALIITDVIMLYLHGSAVS